ncbi:MAG: hypothetical protein ACUVRA_04130 [Candidatus Bathyarchaeaceae archaeon]
MTGIIVSIHKDYRDYMQKLTLLRKDWGQYIEEMQNFVSVFGEGTLKEFSLEYLIEYL